MEEKPNYYAIIPANVRYDNTLKANEKLLYGEITSLAQSTGECWATNKYFAELYDVKPNAIITWIRNLKEKGYIAVDYEYNGKEITKRIITIGNIEKNRPYYLFEYGGTIQKSVENNTSINNKENNNINIITKERFKKPTLEEIETYCKERNSSVNPKTFYEYFETGNWIDSKGNKVKNWKQKLITWEKNTKVKEESSIPYWMQDDWKPEGHFIDDKDYDDEMSKLLSEMGVNNVDNVS